MYRIQISMSFACVEMPMLLSAIAGVLLMHQSLGSIAVDSLNAIAMMDSKTGTQFLLAILFYSNVFNKKDVIGQNMSVSFPFISELASLVLDLGILCSPLSIVLQLKLLGMLPALASHSWMIPVVVQTILPMLQKDSKPYGLFSISLL